MWSEVVRQVSLRGKPPHAMRMRETQKKNHVTDWIKHCLFLQHAIHTSINSEKQQKKMRLYTNILVYVITHTVVICILCLLSYKCESSAAILHV